MDPCSSIPPRPCGLASRTASAKPWTRRLIAGISCALLGWTTLNASEERSAPQVVFETSLGSFTVELDPVRAPISSENFLKHVRSSHYDGLIFHRVVAGFVVQTGGFEPDMNEREVAETIELESNNGLSNVTGSLGMARTGDPNSASSQFYVNTVDNLNLDARPDFLGYAVFGKVIDGMDTIHAIERVPVHSVNSMKHVPVEPVVIHSATEVRTSHAE